MKGSWDFYREGQGQNLALTVSYVPNSPLPIPVCPIASSTPPHHVILAPAKPLVVHAQLTYAPPQSRLFFVPRLQDGARKFTTQTSHKLPKVDE